MSIAENLIRLRKKAGLSQPALAQKSGVSQQLISQLENGVNITTKKLPDLARALGVSIYEIDENFTPDAGPTPAAPSSKFIRNKSFKFYVTEWREFMGVRPTDAAQALNLPEGEYDALEVYPINLSLAQVQALAELFGIRGEQFWFPPPKGRAASTKAVPAKKREATAKQKPRRSKA